MSILNLLHAQFLDKTILKNQEFAWFKKFAYDMKFSYCDITISSFASVYCIIYNLATCCSENGYFST